MIIFVVKHYYTKHLYSIGTKLFYRTLSVVSYNYSIIYIVITLYNYNRK